MTRCRSTCRRLVSRKAIWPQHDQSPLWEMKRRAGPDLVAVGLTWPAGRARLSAGGRSTVSCPFAVTGRAARSAMAFHGERQV